jgi:hypothetical protein
MNKYFGPLNKSACLYFYILSIFFGFMFMIVLLGTILFTVFKYNKTDKMFFSHSFVILANTILGYFVNRLLYSMCIGSLV